MHQKNFFTSSKSLIKIEVAPRKVVKYHALANKYLNETSVLIEFIEEIMAHKNCNVIKIITGCLKKLKSSFFGSSATYIKNAIIIPAINGSVGKSVPRLSVTLNSIEHGIKNNKK